MNSGIYKIFNKENSKCYFGSAIDFNRRWNVHLHELNAGNHGNFHLQAAWNKYGAGTFEFSIILKCSPEKCLMYEQMCLDLYWDGGIKCYNINPTAGSPLGIKRSQETKNKMSAAHLGRPTWNKGKILTPEIKKHMSEAKQKEKHPLFGKKHSPGSRAKMSKARIGKIPYNKGKKHPLGKTWRVIDGKRVWIKDGT